MIDRRISIVGCSGAGKSTLARRLERTLGLPRLELDGVYHQKNWAPPNAVYGNASILPLAGTQVQLNVRYSF